MPRKGIAHRLFFIAASYQYLVGQIDWPGTASESHCGEYCFP